MDIQEQDNTVKTEEEPVFSNVDNCNRSEKTKSNHIFEANTICNLDLYLTNCGLKYKRKFEYSMNVLNDEQTKSLLADISLINTFPNHQNSPFTEPINSKINEKEPRTDVQDGNLCMTLDEVINTDNTVFTDKKINKYSSQINEEIKNAKDSNSSNSSNCDTKDCLDELKCDQISSNQSLELSDDVKRVSRRSSKKKRDFDECCPICGVTVRLHDLDYHYSQEVEKLAKISKISRRSHQEEPSKIKAFQQIKKNRESRLTARVARYSARAKSEVKCPVCSLRMSGTAEEINKHVAYCIQDDDSDEMIVVDCGDEDESESFEEYEIGDETRIRTISLVPGGYRSLQGNSSNRQTAEDEVLNVDIDDTLSYGDPQYTEMDVIPDVTSEKDREDLEKLRKAVVKDLSTTQPQILDSHKWSKEDTNTEKPESSRHVSDLNPIISSLKEKIKDLEDQNKSVKCLICLESYSKPVVSTACWHVHCEECWLMTMGVKKLCPQCNMIVFPSDLRKIYL